MKLRTKVVVGASVLGLAFAWNLRIPPTPASPLTGGSCSLKETQIGGTAQQSTSCGSSNTMGTSTSALKLSLTLSRPALESASSDPFTLPILSATVLPKASPPPVVVAAPQQTTPVAPPLNLRFTGRMTAPDSTPIIFAAFGETHLELKAGQSLPNGYRVETINATSVEFSYPFMKTSARLELPESPKFEIR